MPVVLDTDVVIHLRDGDDWVNDRLREFSPPHFVSAITRVELENGVVRDPDLVALRRRTLDIVMLEIATLGIRAQEIAAYRAIVEALGYSRRKMADRLTAATAIVAGIPLITFNGKDFRDVPGLHLIEWVRPGE